MGRVNYPMTIDQLIEEAVKYKRKYGGNHYVFVSDDEEGNGFHECYFTFSNAVEIGEDTNDIDSKQCALLG